LYKLSVIVQHLFRKKIVGRPEFFADAPGVLNWRSTEEQHRAARLDNRRATTTDSRRPRQSITPNIQRQATRG
jgi:hypothetical protein